MKKIHNYHSLLFITFLLFAVFFTNKAKAQVDSTATDSLMLKQVEQLMGNQKQEPPPQKTRSGISTNPDIGVVADFQSSYISTGKKKVDAYLNETEVSFKSVVDPYIRADFFVSFSRDPVTHNYGVNVEEGYLTTLALPYKLQLKAGKFKEAVGRINPTHAHALPFVDLPN